MADQAKADRADRRPEMQLAAECSTLAANTTANTGHAANMNALAASAITATAAAARSGVPRRPKRLPAPAD